MRVEQRIQAGLYAVRTGLGGAILGHVTFGPPAACVLFVFGVVVGWKTACGRPAQETA